MTDAPAPGRIGEPLTVGVLGAAALVVVNPPDGGIPWCPSAVLFGVACPLCGLTRGVARFVRGDVASSLEFHPLAGAIVLLAAFAWAGWLGRRAGWWTWRSPRFERWAVFVTMLGLVAIWMARLATDTLPQI